jgi:hypothetical protein
MVSALRSSIDRRDGMKIAHLRGIGNHQARSRPALAHSFDALDPSLCIFGIVAFLARARIRYVDVISLLVAAMRALARVGVSHRLPHCQEGARGIEGLECFVFHKILEGAVTQQRQHKVFNLIETAFNFRSQRQALACLGQARKPWVNRRPVKPQTLSLRTLPYSVVIVSPRTRMRCLVRRFGSPCGCYKIILSSSSSSGASEVLDDVIEPFRVLHGRFYYGEI